MRRRDEKRLAGYSHRIVRPKIRASLHYEEGLFNYAAHYYIVSNTCNVEVVPALDSETTSPADNFTLINAL